MSVPLNTEERAKLSRGTSADPIYELVAKTIAERRLQSPTVVDVGCGTGALATHIRQLVGRYVGVDAARYEGFPAGDEFIVHDLDSQRIPLPDAVADIVVAVEVIEHIENPRALVRELTRLCRTGGWIVVTTPNQLSLLSKLTFLLKNQFNAFQESSYPAHLTALLEVDLLRICAECGLMNVTVDHTHRGRIAGTAMHYPSWVASANPRLFSDNVLVAAQRP